MRKKEGCGGGEIKYDIDRSKPFKIEIILEDLSNADKINMRSLIQPFFDKIQQESIFVNDTDKTIEFKFLDTEDLYEIIKHFLQKKNTDEVFELLKLMVLPFKA